MWSLLPNGTLRREYVVLVWRYSGLGVSWQRPIRLRGAFGVGGNTNYTFSGPGYSLDCEQSSHPRSYLCLEWFFNTEHLTSGGCTLISTTSTGMVEMIVQRLLSWASWLAVQDGDVHGALKCSAVTVRICRDGTDVQLGEVGYVDEVALTPIEQFVEPNVRWVPRDVYA